MATKRGLEPGRARGRRAGGDHPGADPEPGQLTRSGSWRPTRPGRCRPARSNSKTRRATSPVEAIAITTTGSAAGAGPRPGGSSPSRRARRRRHRDQVGDLGQRRGRLPHRLVDLATQLRELQLDPRLPRRRPRFQQQVDVTPVSGVGRDPPRRGVRMGQIARRLEQRQLRPHRRGPPLDLGHLGHLFRRHRPRRREIRIDDQLQNQFLSLGEHASHLRKRRTAPARGLPTSSSSASALRMIVVSPCCGHRVDRRPGRRRPP